MMRKIVLAALAAASLGIALPGTSTSASAEHWGGPRYGHGGAYGSRHDHGYGPPPWVVRRWHWRHRHMGPPAYYAPAPGRFYSRPDPYRPGW